MPETGNKALDAITRRQNLAIDSTVAWFERSLRDLVTQAQLRTMAELTRRLKIVDGRIAPTAANQQVLREIETVFRAALKRAGYDELVEELVGSFGNQFTFFEDTMKLLGEKPVTFGVAEQKFFAAQQESVADTLQGIVRNAAEAARQRALLTIGGLGLDELTEILARQTGKTIAQSAAIADTAQSTFYRTIAEKGFARIEKTQPKSRPLSYRLYGPDDRLNRPFCRKILDAQTKGKSYTREEIDAMDNGQLPNVMLTGGGYRCRHGWIFAKAVPVPADGTPVPPVADPDAVLRVGRLDRAIAKEFAPRNAESTVVLTQERLDHFSQPKGREATFNPRHVVQAVLDPEFVYRDRKNADTGLFYRKLDDGHYLAVAVKFAARKGRQKHSIITAHPVRDRGFRRLPRRDLVWQRAAGE